jgi:hypothetical protein
MPISYVIDKLHMLVRTTATGTLTERDLLEHKRKLMNDPHFEAGMRELSDVRGVEDLHVTPKGVLSMMQIDEKHSSKLRSFKLAILVSQDFVFGMARMYQSLTEKNIPYVGVFKDYQEALQWLDIHGAD